MALIDDNGNETDWQYDCLGRKVLETKGVPEAPASGGPNLADVNPGATTIQWTYNATTGFLNSMTREDGSVLTYTYDSRDAGRLVSVSVTSPPSEDNPPLAGTTAQTFTYDGPGHRLTSTDNNDPATAADDADCAWRYDSLGRTIEESQQLGTTGTLAVVSYQYTANDRAALVYPNGRTMDYTYHYPGGPLKTLTDDGASSAIAQYDYLGGRTLVRAMQNGVNLDLRGTGGAAFFDASGRPTQWLHRDTNQAGSPTKIGFEYAYDGNGNKLYQKSVHDPLDSQRYAYDSADRLTSFVRGRFDPTPLGFCGPSTGTWTGMDEYEGWNLDGLGNWGEYTARKAGPTSATATTTVEKRIDDTFNAYARVGEDANGQGGTPQTHDPNGNLTNDGKKVLKWDAMNRLREVWTTTSTLVAKYTYDTVGRRLAKTVQPGFPGESGVFRFADWRILEDCTPGAPPATKRQYTYGNYLDEVLTMDTDLTTNGLCTDPGDRRLFYHQNNLFSVYALTDSSGNVVEGYEYDPYGKYTLILDGNDADSVVNFDGTDHRYAAGSAGICSQNGNEHTFTGKSYDRESGMHWFNTRYYSPVDGVFAGMDPIGYKSGDNLLQYVRSSPLGYTDPSGLSGENPNYPPPYGPKPYQVPKPRQCCGTCGPDVTEALTNLLRHVEQEFERWEIHDPAMVEYQCGLKAAGGNWDIPELHWPANYMSSQPKCGTGDCAKDPTDPGSGSVMVNGSCFNASEVNYALWGAIGSNCQRSRLAMQFYAWVWRFGNYGELSSSESFWVGAGYDFKGSLPKYSGSNDKSYCKSCGESYKGALHFNWGAYDETNQANEQRKRLLQEQGPVRVN